MNFESFKQPKLPDYQSQMVEFRQHYSLLDAAKNGYWVCLLTVLMRTVEKWAGVMAPPPSSIKAH
jgi:hypothetical protein